jgi:hypothetical protein
MPIRLSPEQRTYLERLARGRIEPTPRQKALALLRLDEGDTSEMAAQCAGIEEADVETLASSFTEGGLAGIGLDGGDEAGHPRVSSLQDDALFKEFRKILKARRKRRARRRKRRARREGSAE